MPAAYVSSASTPAPGRSTTIDAFRGIAAICVVVEHLLLSWPDPIVPSLHAWLYYTPLEALFSDGKFIRIFFVISGFVMFLPFDRRPGFSVPESYRRRFWRIYPAFLIAIAIAIDVQCLLPDAGPVASSTPWFNTEAQLSSIGWQQVLAMITFSGTADSIKINCVTWSLVQEIRVIILFPLIAYCVRRSGLLTLFVSIAASIIATIVYPLVGETGYFITAETGIGAVCTTLHFLPLFVIGMVLAQRLEFFLDLLALTTPIERMALWVAAFIVIRRPQEFAAGAGAALLIILSMRTPAVTRALASAPLQWLGKRSYSLYLLHMPIMVLTLHLLDGVLPIGTNLLIALAMSLLASDVFENHIASLFVAKNGRTARAPSHAPATSVPHPA